MRKQNIFLDLGFPKHEAVVMLLRSELAGNIRKWHEGSGMTQVAAAADLGISAPRLNEILKNRVEKVSVDYLPGLCAKLGLPVNVKNDWIAPIARNAQSVQQVVAPDAAMRKRRQALAIGKASGAN